MPALWLGSSLRRLRVSAKALALPGLVGFLALAVLGFVVRPGTTAHAAAPPVSYTLVGTAGANGWHRSNVTVKWVVIDDGQLPSKAARRLSSSRLKGHPPRTCIARLTRGATSTARRTVKIDKTLPSIPVGTAARAADANGWYNHAVAVTFVEHRRSFGDRHLRRKLIRRPGLSDSVRSGSCTDKAGNTSSGAFSLSYDSTPPTPTAAASRAPDANGWYNRASRSPSRRRRAICPVWGRAARRSPTAAPIPAPRPSAGSCTDRAGNTSAPVALAFKYDATPPSATGAPERSPDANGWYNHAVALALTGTDATSGIGACGGPSYACPDGSARTMTGSCTDRAGNTSASVTATIKYDATAPTASGSLARGPDANGWYNHPVAFNLTGSDATSGIGTCGGSYAGPDGTGRQAVGRCTDVAGNQSSAVTATIDYDSTKPTATATADRPPNTNGWYRSPLTISFTQLAGDVSGPDTCSAPASYSGPDTASATRSGTCTDRAGNTSAPASATIKYDATPPTASGALARPPDANGWYNHPVALGVSGTDATSGIASCSGPSYSGPTGRPAPSPDRAPTRRATRTRP